MDRKSRPDPRTVKPGTSFSRFAKWTAYNSGRPSAFLLAAVVILGWAVTGPIFHFSDTWQLVINTGTTIVTFLMVFVIQNTQMRDTEAMHLKLDELIRATEGAHTALLDLEELEEETLESYKRRYLEVARKARENLKRGIIDTGCPEA